MFDAVEPQPAVPSAARGATLRRVAILAGVCVEVAGSVTEALNALRRNRPDVVLTDIGMPGEDGDDLLQRLRTLHAELGGGGPVAAVTAYASAEDRRRMLQAGFALHLTKPLEVTELVRAVLVLARPAQ